MEVNKIFSTKQMLTFEGNHLKKLPVKNINKNINIFFNKSLIASYYNNCFDFSNIYNQTKSIIKTSITYNSKIGGIINIHDSFWKNYYNYTLIDPWSLKIKNNILNSPIDYCKFGYDSSQKFTPTTNKHYDIYKILNNDIKEISNKNIPIFNFNKKKLNVCKKFIIPNSCFTSLNLYKNLRPAVYCNNADIFSCIGCYGKYKSSLVLPQYGLRFNMHNSLLFLRQNQWFSSDKKIDFLFHLFNDPQLLHFNSSIINKDSTVKKIPKLKHNIKRSRRNKIVKTINEDFLNK
jgi:hypothetical protein